MGLKNFLKGTLTRFPSVRKHSEVMEVMKKIWALEKEGNYEGAARVRTKALDKFPVEAAASLWNSEGQYLLHEKEDYYGAYAAYEKALEGALSSDALRTMTDREALYAGAAMAAIKKGDLETAREHYKDFRAWIAHPAGVKAGKKSASRTKWREEINAWLAEELDA